MILIVGCGYLGSYLQKEFSEKSNETVLATVRNSSNLCSSSTDRYAYCDVTDYESVKKLASLCKDEELTVFYLAACHNIDYVFENPAEAEKINVDALKNFFEAVPNIKKLFFASTDCVYGEGKNLQKKFSESDLLNPVNEYGKQKIKAEKIVLRNGHTVLRLPFMIGPSLSKKPHFYDKITSALLKGENVEMIDGMYRSVLSFSQVADIMHRLSLLPYNTLPKVINLCGNEGLSKYQTGCAIAEKIGAPTESIKKLTEEDGEKFFKDKRASSALMDNSLLKKLTGLKEIKWEV